MFRQSGIRVTNWLAQEIMGIDVQPFLYSSPTYFFAFQHLNIRKIFRKR
jgi:hypothetical protein